MSLSPGPVDHPCNGTSAIPMGKAQELGHVATSDAFVAPRSRSQVTNACRPVS